MVKYTFEILDICESLIFVLIGHGFAEKLKKQALSDYRKVLSKEKNDLKSWSEKLQKIYNEEVSDEEKSPETTSSKLLK